MSLVQVESKTSEILIPIGEWTYIEAEFTRPADALGAVLFAHGSGSSRHSARSRYVAAQLNLLHFATVIAELEMDETGTGNLSLDLRLDTTLRTERVEQIAAWAHHSAEIGSLPIGIIGSGNGAAAALDAAALRPDAVAAVVCRGARIDLARHLPGVKAPTLLIVGEKDGPGLEAHRKASRFLTCEHEIRVIPGASHLFEERGALDAVAAAAGAWFRDHLKAPNNRRR